VKFAWWKAAVIAVILVWVIWNVIPRGGREFFNVRLGLDLKGGSYLVMQVQTDDAIKAEGDVLATRVGEKLHKEGFPGVRVAVGEAGQVLVSGVPAGRVGDAETLIKQDVSGWPLATTADGLILEMPGTERDRVKDSAVKQALTTIRNRIDALGVGETNVQRLGGMQNDRILVELPGVEDPGRVKNIMQTQARLELRLAYYRQDGAGPFRAATKDEVLGLFGGSPPLGTEVLPYEETDKQTLAKTQREWMLVEKASVITGGDLQDARPSQDQWNQTVVSFQLRVAAADRFAKFTRANVNRQMPIVLDGKIVSAPVIRSEIGISGQIEGGFTPQSAEDLSLQLRAGALPARVVTIEERTVGPSLGADSIRSGLTASAIAAVFTCIFMLVYYKLSGVNALIALALNMLILFAAMSRLEAALTLPGIAGLALTVGMAVDANVLVFERIREELRAGRSVPAAVAAGFQKALSAILDSNITTIIAAFFLFQYGTGPVKGFAVTLIIGLIANMFTAVFVSRTLFEAVLSRRTVERLSV